MESRKCTKCNKLKPMSDFSRDSHKKSGYRPSCKVCCANQKREHHIANPHLRSERGKRYYLNNKDLIKSKVKAYAPSYLKAKRESNPVFRSKHSLSVRIRNAWTKGQTYTKTSELFTIVGIDNDGLVNHLNSTFEYNYGLPRECINLADVEIDHIIPLSTAQTVEDVRRLNHYTNLQLLFKEDNQAKGTKITLDFTPNLV